MTLKVRAETDADYDIITRISDLASGQKQEGNLVLNLKKRPEFDSGLPLIAEIRGGYIYYPRKFFDAI